MDDERTTDITGGDPAEGSRDHVVTGLPNRADPALLERAQRLVDIPLAARPDAFDRLNRDVAAALRAIEEA